MSDKKLSWTKENDTLFDAAWTAYRSDGLYMVLKDSEGFRSCFTRNQDTEKISKGANNFTEAATECEIHAFGTARDIDHLTAFANIMTKFAALSDEDKASALEEIEKLLHV